MQYLIGFSAALTKLRTSTAIPRLLRTFACVLVVVLGIVSCGTEPGDILAPDALDVAPTSVDDGKTVLEIVPQFEVQLVATGPLRPGHISLEAVIRANLRSSGVEIRVTAPDAEIAKANGWTGRKHWPEPGIPSVAESQTSLPKGQSYIQPVELEVPSPGYYRIIVSAVGDLEIHPDVPGLIQNAIHEEFWLWISEADGKITKEFDTSLFLPSYVERSGPLTPILRSPPRDLAPATLSSTVLEVKYANQDSSNILTPVPGARVVFKIFDQFENRIVYQTEFATDATGRFTADCPAIYPGYDTHIYEVYAQNSDMSVLGTTTIAYVQLYPGDILCENATNVLYATSWARVFTNLKVVISASRSFLGYSRGIVSVVQTSGDVSYEPSTDKILYRFDTIWGPAGFFATGHEYGHAVHNKALGGLNPNFNSNCLGHLINAPSSYGCALSEGFGDFHAVKIWGSRSAHFSEVVALLGIPAGPKVEGTIAAFFFDLLDGITNGEISESHDTTQYPGFYLATILKTCKYNGSNRASGIDHIVYCLENSLSSRTGHHWSDRSAVSSYSETATEPAGWSATAIFNNWHWNIYRH